MNKIWLIAVTAGLVLALGIGGVALAQNGGSTSGSGSGTGAVTLNVPNQQSGIWVNGQGKVTVAPDVAILQLGVQAQAASVADAQSQASTAMDKVMSALTGNGVAQKDIKTTYFNITQVTKWDDKTQTQVVIGYQVSNTVTAKIRTLSKAGTVIDAVAAAGGDLTRINGITFTLDDPTAAMKQARDLAMADAKAKAQQLASDGGVTLGKPTYISDNSYVPTPPMYAVPAAKDAAAGSVATPISSGEMDITVNVQVTYAIVQ
jgi:uncharacterized protein YggE